MEKKFISILEVQTRERARKSSYRNTGIPFKPVIYHIDEEKADYPKKHERKYDPFHWMVGNIITNKQTRTKIPFDKKRSRRGSFAIWYSIDGLTSHYLTYDSFKAIAPNFKHYYIRKPSNGIMPEENPFDNPFDRLTYNVINDTKTSTLIIMVRRCLSALCRRVNERKHFDLSNQENLRYCIERSIVKLISDPQEIADLMEHVIKEHKHVHDGGFISQLSINANRPQGRIINYK